jgi:hypothetical protein
MEASLPVVGAVARALKLYFVVKTVWTLACIVETVWWQNTT